MFSFRKKKPEVEEENRFEDEKIPMTKVKDLNPKNRKRRKEPIKIWTKKERIIVLVILGLTLIIPLGLTLASKGGLSTFHLPSFKLPSLTETVVIKKDGNTKPTSRIPLPITVKNEQDLISDINNLISDQEGNYSVWVEELDTPNLSYGLNENRKSEGASLFKLPLMIAVYRGIESGKITEADISDALYRLAKNSDNGAFVDLSNIVGYPAIRQAITDADMPNTSIDDSVTTPHDIGNLFKNLYNNKLVTEKSKNEILDLLTNTSEEFLIPQGIPDTRVAHKYGAVDNVLNDGGIVFAKKPFILVIMTENIDGGEATDNIPQISKLVYNFEKTQ